MTTAELYQIFLQHPSVQTDTRALQKGDLFFALKGPNFNGNLFAVQALEAGAAYAIVDEVIDTALVDGAATVQTYREKSSAQSPNGRLILVPDVLTALQDLARHHRQQFTIPFIAITGSNGKTTSKELMATVLSSHFKTHTTVGNLNNHIGVPLTLLRTPLDTQMAVIEMGANHQKEIESYCRYTLPDAGVITNCGKAHLEGFGGIEGVRKGKGELYDFLRNAGNSRALKGVDPVQNHGAATQQGLVFAYANYDYLVPMRAGLQQVVLYGDTETQQFLLEKNHEEVQVLGRMVEQEPFLTVEITKNFVKPNTTGQHIEAKNETTQTNSNTHISAVDTPWTIATQLVGDYNLPNVLCAVAIGQYYGVPNQKIKAAIEAYAPSNSRSQLITRGTNKMVLDAYNANPSSMAAAIKNFATVHANNKVLLLGGMMELGEESLAEHQQLVALLQQYSWTQVVLVGGDFGRINHPYLYCANAAEAKVWMAAQQFEDTYFLIKGSRSFKMETVL